VMLHLLSSVRVRLAAAFSALTAAVFCWTTRQAVRPHRVSQAATSSWPTLPARVQSTDNATEALIDSAFERDPFSPTRQAHIPPEPASIAKVAAPAATEALHLVGTVVDSSGGSFVLCQLGAGPPRVLRVGEELGAYQLHSISQGAATFVNGDGQRVELRVSKTGS
jgi:hypothetical protein